MFTYSENLVMRFLAQNTNILQDAIKNIFQEVYNYYVHKSATLIAKFNLH
jgi:hypothetical protein